MTQSRKTGNPTPITPQRNAQSKLIKSAPTNKTSGVQMLSKGNTLNQIFSNSRYIFKVSSTLERLYRYRFDPLTNEVVEILVFKQVRNEDSKLSFFSSYMPQDSPGISTPFQNTEYQVFPLFEGKKFHGYMISPKEKYGYNQAAKLYFKFEKIEKKER